ncbi:caspase domain-containing protein [Rhizobium sp. PP-F2F-G38]|nr:caspase domain-containing protein [Rhizobium sp. PP-F2F-G38]
MTLVRNVDTGGKAAVRALVIGVGKYPWLVGGMQARDVRVTEGMGQLASPPISAREFAAWVEREFWHPDRQVATIDLLLSDPDSDAYSALDGTVHPIEPATRNGIKEAARRWKNAAGPDDLLLFFFCGHGIVSGFQVGLLAEDYGSDEEQPFDGAFGFDGFVETMRGATAARQVFFVDACRVGSDALLRSQHVYRLDPLLGLPFAMNPDVKQAVYYSTLPGQPAFGRIDQQSLFTTALLRSLRGAAATDNNDRWAIETTMLQRSLDFFLDDIADPANGRLQTPQTGMQAVFEIVGMQVAPVVPLMLRPVWHEGEEPPDEVQDVSIRRDDGFICAWAHPWPPGESTTWAPSRFATDLEVGWRYTCTVSFSGGDPFVSQSRHLMPPYRIVEVRRDGDS